MRCLDSIVESTEKEQNYSIQLHDLFGDSSDEEENYKIYIGKYEKEDIESKNKKNKSAGRKEEKKIEKNTNNSFNKYWDEVEIYPELEKFRFKELGREIDNMNKREDVTVNHFEYAAKQ